MEKDKNMEEFLNRNKSEEEIKLELIKEQEKLKQKGFLPKNKELDETTNSPMEFVEKDPRKYIIEECIDACMELWSKNIYTYMCSDHLNEDECWIEIKVRNLSPENMDIFSKLDDVDIIKFSYHKGCVNFGVKCVGAKAKEKLLTLAKNFKMQDVPYNEAYISVEEFLIKCGCYSEVDNPNYTYMESPLGMDLPADEMVSYFQKYDDWYYSEKSSEKIKKFDKTKMKKSLEEYVKEHNVIYDNNRICLSDYHYQKHLNYVNSLKNNSDMANKLI